MFVKVLVWFITICLFCLVCLGSLCMRLLVDLGCVVFLGSLGGSCFFCLDVAVCFLLVCVFWFKWICGCFVFGFADFWWVFGLADYYC